MSAPVQGSDSPIAGNGRTVVLVVIDSHLLFADALAEQLRREIGTSRVVVAQSVTEACESLDPGQPDVVVVHDEHRGHDELGTLHELARHDVDVLVLVLSGTEDVTTIIDALRSGARGWISKDMDMGSVVAAIEQVAQGYLFLSPPVLTTVLHRFLTSMPVVGGNHAFVDSLSQRELEILRCLVAGMSKAEIASRLYLSIHTVRSHIQRMMRRSDQHSTLSLVALARHVGVPPIDEPQPGRTVQQRPSDGGTAP